jgi:hypothetical protein
MGAYNSITKALNPLGVYNITPGANIYNELMAYSYALDIYSGHIDSVFADRFITTSSLSNIEKLEKIFGYKRSERTLADRRNMLINRLSITNGDFTKLGLDKFIQSLGIGSYDLSESPSIGYIAVQIYTRFSDTLERWMSNQIKSFLPAGTAVDVFFGGRFWDTIDDYSYDFAYMDSLNITWKQLDELE